MYFKKALSPTVLSLLTYPQQETILSNSLKTNFYELLKSIASADYKTDLAQFETRIKEFCSNQKILNKERIINTLAYIESLVPGICEL